MRDGRISHSTVLRPRPRVAEDSTWALAFGSFLLLLALLFGSFG